MSDSKEEIPLPEIFVRLHDEQSGHTCVYPRSFNQSHFESAMRYKADPTDVFVCAFAKSGTTWTQYIVWLILHGGTDLPDDRPMAKCIPMLEFDGCDVVKATRNTDGVPRIVKTHFEWALVPKGAAKYVYCARNPWDVVVSYLFHIRGFESYSAPDLTIEQLFPTFAHAHVEFGNHTSHVADWYRASRDPANDIHFFLYENMKRDPEGEILKIARHLGDEYHEALTRDDRKLLRHVIEKSSFGSMSSAPNKKWVQSERKGTNFVRKGVVGDYKNHLSEEQIKVLKRVMEEDGEKLGIGHLWKNKLME